MRQLLRKAIICRVSIQQSVMNLIILKLSNQVGKKYEQQQGSLVLKDNLVI